MKREGRDVNLRDDREVEVGKIEDRDRRTEERGQVNRGQSQEERERQDRNMKDRDKGR